MCIYFQKFSISQVVILQLILIYRITTRVRKPNLIQAN